jgi:transcriptional regulator with XRE-family HTH domain
MIDLRLPLPDAPSPERIGSDAELRSQPALGLVVVPEPGVHLGSSTGQLGHEPHGKRQLANGQVANALPCGGRRPKLGPVKRRGAEEPEKGTSGWRIWDRKRALGIEQDKDLEAKTGILSGTIGRYRKNERGLSAEAAELLARELGVTAKWLIYGTDDPSPQQIAERASRGRADTPKPKAERVQTDAPVRTVERDDAPWRQLADHNPSFRTFARGYMHRMSKEDRAEEAESALDYAADEGLPRDRTEGGASKKYSPEELRAAVEAGEAYFRGEDLPKVPKTPFVTAPKTSTPTLAAGIAAAKAKPKR